VGHTILLLQHRHPLVVGLHELADVLERRPDHVLDAGGLRGVGDVLRLGLFLLAREVLPEVRDGVDAIRARKRLLEALDVVEVGFHDLRAGRSERLSLVLVRVARDGAASESARGVRQDRAAESAALRAGRAEYGDDFFVGHGEFLDQTFRKKTRSINAFRERE
jgi:hypothetical protein